MQNLFSANHFVFPYNYKFAGQASDERILYVTREHEVMKAIRQTVVVIAAVIIFASGDVFAGMLEKVASPSIVSGIQVFAAIVAAAFLLIGIWWVSELWKKSIVVMTNKRLTKFVYTTPWNRHILSLPLDMIVDTGSYSKGFFQAIFRLGTLTARSSASSSGAATDDPERINKKYFYIENVGNFEDIQHYLNKVLFVYRQDWTKLENYRPFLPHLKGDARKEFMQQYPEYWS